jgi:hypothetical protein
VLFLIELDHVKSGPVLGRVALRFIAQADSLQEIDLIISSLPIWPLAETRVTPLISFDERRNYVQKLLEKLATPSQAQGEIRS